MQDWKLTDKSVAGENVEHVVLTFKNYHTKLINVHNNNNNNNTLIYIAPACRMTSEALADSSSRATECLTEK